MGQLPGPSSGAEQSDASLWIILQVQGPPPRCTMEASGAQAHGSQTGWNQKADGWDFWTTMLPHQQPIRRKSYILKLYPQIAFKNSSLKATGEFGLFEHWDVRSPCLALAINLSLLQNPTLWFAYLPCRAHKLGFNNILSHYCFKFVFCSFLSFFSSWWYCAPQTGI